MLACIHATLLKLCLTLCEPMDCSSPGFSVHRILQAGILEWVAIPFSRGSYKPTIEPTSLVSPALAGVFFTSSATVKPTFSCFSSVQSLSRVRLFATPWTAAHQASLSITNSWSLLKLTSIKFMMPFNYLILCCSLLLWPSNFPSIGVFSNKPLLHIRWSKYWSFSFCISPSIEYSLISFRMDWLDLLAVQGTLKSLLHHHSSKASILQHRAFFMVQLSHPYMTTGKTTVLTRQAFVRK